MAGDGWRAVLNAFFAVAAIFLEISALFAMFAVYS